MNLPAEPCEKKRDAHAGYRVEYPEVILLGIVVDYHMTAYLTDVEPVIPDLNETYHLVGDDVEDEDVERVVAGIDQKSLEDAVSAVDPSADVVGHQEAKDGGDGQREELRIGGTPVHVRRQIDGEEIDDGAEE